MSLLKVADRDAVRAMSSGAFFTSGNTGQLEGSGTLLAGMLRHITAYRLPSTATTDERLFAMIALTLCGRSTNGEVSNWQSFVLSYTGLAFPEVITEITTSSRGEIEFLEFPPTFVTAIRSIDAALEADPTARVVIPFPGVFPIGPAEITAAESNCASILGCYGYYALIVHLMGKRINTDTRENMTIRRPGNLIDGFHAQSEEFILRGDGRMSDHAHTSINTAWDMLTSVKQVLVPKFTLLDRSTGVPGQMVYTMFDMLKNSGMQPAALVHQLISAFPWIDEVPMLRPEYDFYVKSLTDYSRLPAPVRPYLKVMYGNTTKIFHAKSLANLTAIAVMFLKAATPTLQGYTAPGGEAAKATFLYELKKRGLRLSAPPANEGALPEAEVV